MVPLARRVRRRRHPLGCSAQRASDSEVGRQEFVIDRGANFICDLLLKAGCEPFASYEGIQVVPTSDIAAVMKSKKRYVTIC